MIRRLEMNILVDVVDESLWREAGLDNDCSAVTELAVHDTH